MLHQFQKKLHSPKIIDIGYYMLGKYDNNTKIKVEQSKNYLDCQSYIKFFADQILNFGQAFSSYKKSK